MTLSLNTVAPNKVPVHDSYVTAPFSCFKAKMCGYAYKRGIPAASPCSRMALGHRLACTSPMWAFSSMHRRLWPMHGRPRGFVEGQLQPVGAASCLALAFHAFSSLPDAVLETSSSPERHPRQQVAVQAPVIVVGGASGHGACRSPAWCADLHGGVLLHISVFPLVVRSGHGPPAVGWSRSFTCSERLTHSWGYA